MLLACDRSHASSISSFYELFASDFKRHDVGATLAGSKPFHQIAANQFITPSEPGRRVTLTPGAPKWRTQMAAALTTRPPPSVVTREVDDGVCSVS